MPHMGWKDYKKWCRMGAIPESPAPLKVYTDKYLLIFIESFAGLEPQFFFF